MNSQDAVFARNHQKQLNEQYEQKFDKEPMELDEMSGFIFYSILNFHTRLMAIEDKLAKLPKYS